MCGSINFNMLQQKSWQEWMRPPAGCYSLYKLLQLVIGCYSLLQAASACHRLPKPARACYRLTQAAAAWGAGSDSPGRGQTKTHQNCDSAPPQLAARFEGERSVEEGIL